MWDPPGWLGEMLGGEGSVGKAPLKGGLNWIHFQGPFQAHKTEQAKHPCVCTPHLFTAAEASSACWNRNPFDPGLVEFRTQRWSSGGQCPELSGHCRSPSSDSGVKQKGLQCESKNLDSASKQHGTLSV